MVDETVLTDEAALLGPLVDLVTTVVVVVAGPDGAAGLPG
jgi:hypothetical protein